MKRLNSLFTNLQNIGQEICTGLTVGQYTTLTIARFVAKLPQISEESGNKV